MKKTLIAFAAIAAMVGVGYADTTTWFDGKAGDSSATPVGGSWTSPTPDGVTRNATNFTLDDVDAFAFTASASQSPSSAQNLSFTTSIAFSYAYDELPDVGEDKIGVIARENDSVTHYWVLGKSNSATAWLDSGIVASDLDTAVSVNVVISNGTDSAVWAIYNIGGSTYPTEIDASATSFSIADYSGSGVINSLLGQLIALGIVVPGYNDPIPQGQQLDDWLAKNNMTQDQFKDQATKSQPNGYTAYECCVLGVKTNETLVANATDTSSSKITFGIATTPMSGVTVTYKLMKKGPSDSSASQAASGTTPSFEQDIADGVYYISAQIGNDNISSAKVGAMQVDSSKATEYIAVPWTAFGGATGISPTNLVKASGLTANDTLQVYDAANKDWEAYRWDGTKWNATTDSPHVTTLTRGAAVKLTRSDTSKSVYLVGGAKDDSVETPVESGKWNLVANPGFGDYTIGSSALGDSTKDKVMVANGSVFTQYTCRKSTWAKIVVTTTGEGDKKIQTNTRVTDAEGMKVKQGTGFFFVNGSGKSSINW